MIRGLLYKCKSSVCITLDTISAFLTLTTCSGTFNEKLLLGQGLSINPLKEGGDSAGPKSLREVIQQIDNQKDYHDYVLSHEFNPGAVTSEQAQYHRHPVSRLKLSPTLLLSNFRPDTWRIDCAPGLYPPV